MAIADHFQKAEVLESLSWVKLPENVKIAKLAAGFIKEEKNLKSYRSYRRHGLTDNTVTKYIRSQFVPPRGTMKSLLSLVMDEIAKQKEKRKGRANRATPSLSLSDRKSNVVASLFSSLKLQGRDISEMHCCFFGTINNYIVIVAKDDSYGSPAIYFRNKATGDVTVGDYKHSGYYSDISRTSLIDYITPSKIVRLLLDGVPIRLVPEKQGFDVAGTLVPWQNISNIQQFTGRQVTR